MAHGETGEYTPKCGYNYIMSRKGWGDPEWWSKHLWKLKCPTKARLFFWCLLKRKIPTWDILQSRYMYGRGRCPVCKSDAESINHLFIHCNETKKIWGEVEKLLNIQAEWGNGSLEEVWANWWQNHPDGNMRNLPLIFCWGSGLLGTGVFFKIRKLR